jgi:hypothetical protein
MPTVLLEHEDRFAEDEDEQEDEIALLRTGLEIPLPYFMLRALRL